MLLGLYDVLIRMDWLKQHRAKVDCYSKVVECVDEKGMTTEVRGILRPILVRKISALQLQRFLKKGCQVYAVRISDPAEDKGLSLAYHRVLQEYADVSRKRCRASKKGH